MNTDAIHLLTPPSATEWWRLLFVFIGLVTAIGLGEAVRIHFRWSPEFTRKLIHISVGILIFFAPAIFTTALPALSIATFFILVNYFALRLGLLKGMHGIKRATYGTVYYPLAFLILVILFWYRAPLVMALSILVLALANSAAAIVGESHKAPTVYRLTSDKKSIEGSMAMFVITFVIVFGGIMQFALPSHRVIELAIAVSGITALTATAWEAISSRGLDNLTVPLSTAFVLYFFLYPHPNADPQLFILGAGLSIGIAVGSYYLGFLSLSGSVAMFILATLVFGIGGWKWTLPLLAFFLLSSMLSMVGKRKKAEMADFFEKGSKRDYAQVLANGGIPGILILLSFFFPSYNFYPLFVASVAAVAADTWGTEIGLLGRGRTYLITNLRPVAQGVSGGVSFVGMAGSLLGSLIIVLSSWQWLYTFEIAIGIAIAGLLASVVDSYLGATFQGSYKCKVCGKETERRIHCEQLDKWDQVDIRTELVKGYPWLNNDTVNFLCSASGALIMILFA